VDAVVAAIRKKLGEHSVLVETVRGTGYRYRS
jgi:DNA-binding response OmpR family regulator